MTLTDILGRDLRVEWHEAVALIRDIIERTPNRSIVPELYQVELQEGGQTTIHGGLSVHEPVQRLGQMLQALLVRADTPVQLRLVIANQHESVHAFSEALAFFERPERAAVLQTLYNRAKVANPLTGVDAFVPTPTGANEPPGGDPKQDSLERPRVSRRLVYGTGLIALVVVGCVGALYAGRTEHSPPLAAEVTDTLSKGVSGVTAAVGSAVTAIGQRVGIGGAPTSSEPPKSSSPTVAPPSTRRSGATPVSAIPQIQRAAFSGFDLGADPDPRVARSEVTIVAQPAASDGESVIDTPDPLVYSADAKEVVPPVGLRPQLPKDLPAGVRAEDLTRIELVITADGTVESVKLLDEPRDIHASMLLSAAKAWQFHPATKDSRPVKYRKTVWVAR